jgi:hypothetical protein
MSVSLQDRRTWIVGGAAAAAVISAASWFLVLSPVVSDADAVKSQTAAVKQQNVLAQHKLNLLANSQSQLGRLQTRLVAALAAVPMTNGLPDFTRQLNRQASALGLALTSINVSGISPASSTATTATPGAADTTSAAPSAPASGGASASGNGSSGTAPSTGAPTGAVAISLTVTATGSEKAQLAFIRAIRLNGPRRALVNAVSLTAPGMETGAGHVTMTATLTVFATPQTAEARAQTVKLLELK